MPRRKLIQGDRRDYRSKGKPNRPMNRPAVAQRGLWGWPLPKADGRRTHQRPFLSPARSYLRRKQGWGYCELLLVLT